MPSAWDSSGVAPRARMVSLVLPKKRLGGGGVSWCVGIGDRGGGVPAVAELVADVLEVRVAHVVNAEDEAVLVLGHALPDVGEELLLLLARLLGHLREVERPRAFGLGHGGGGVWVFWGEGE